MEQMDDIMKIVKYIEKSGLLMKVVSETIENEPKEHKCGFLGMLSAILGVHCYWEICLQVKKLSQLAKGQLESIEIQ